MNSRRNHQYFFIIDKMGKRLDGKRYFIDKAIKILKSHGLMLIDQNHIVPIKSFNKLKEDYLKKREKETDDEKKKNIDNMYGIIIGSLHKDSYWDILPKSYKNIIQTPSIES